jgi:hypothetical protein
MRTEGFSTPINNFSFEADGLRYVSHEQNEFFELWNQLQPMQQYLDRSSSIGKAGVMAVRVGDEVHWIRTRGMTYEIRIDENGKIRMVEVATDQPSEVSAI